MTTQSGILRLPTKKEQKKIGAIFEFHILKYTDTNIQNSHFIFHPKIFRKSKFIYGKMRFTNETKKKQKEERKKKKHYVHLEEKRKIN